MKLVTGNDLASGDVIWWTGEGWSRHVGEAVDAGAEGDSVVAREEAALRVNAAFVIEATMGADGPVPDNIKQRIRAFGPTVRGDLAIAPADKRAGSWVI